MPGRAAMTATNQPLMPNIGVLTLVPDCWSPRWMTRHYVMAHLARYFHVVWVNPAPEWRDRFKGRKAETELKSERNLPPGLSVYSPEFWLPHFYRPEWLASFSFNQRMKRARRLLTTRGCQKITLYLWRPEFHRALRSVPFDLSCYHIEDEYTFSEVDLPVHATEARLIAQVDQVFILSPALLEKKGNLNPHTAYVPGGVDTERWAQPLEEPLDLSRIPHPRVGYTGFLKKQLDWPLLLRLSADHPEWSFVFVGPEGHPEIREAVQELSTRRNVYFLGPKTVQDLPAYSQHFDVCIMPYRNDEYTKYIYPLKLHEYLASGRPTVGTRIRSLEGFADVVALASTLVGWSAAITEALNPDSNTAERRAVRQGVARRHDWQLVAAKIAETITRRLGAEYAERLTETLAVQEEPVRFAEPNSGGAGATIS